MKILLETERLILRPFEIADAQELFEMNTDPEVLKYTGDIPLQSLKDAEDFITDYLTNPNGQHLKYQMGRLAVIDKSDSRFLGFCGIKTQDASKITDIGYRFLRKHWGKGYATEACVAALDFAFNTHHKEQIIAHVHEYNFGSQKVAEKLGFTLKHRFLWDGELPGRYYKLTRRTYENRKH